MKSTSTHIQDQEILVVLSSKHEDFLSLWAENMQNAGYLEHTTAKVEDCLVSFQWFMEPIIKHYRLNCQVTFAQLIDQVDWAENIINTARRHRSRGVTPKMFFGCFKTLVHSVEQIIISLQYSSEEKLAALDRIHCYADALETLIIAEWSSTSSKESQKSLDQANRTLTLEKNKYENILSSISDLVVITDEKGIIVEANTAARRLIAPLLEKYSFVWQVLGLEGESIEDVVKYYPMDQSHEISIYDDDFYFELKVIPLSTVSLASHGYIMVLNDITPYVNQRMILEQIVKERTEELVKEKTQVEEMVITLKNVLSTVEHSKEELLNSIAENLENSLLPALTKIKSAESQQVRNSYIDIFEDQLLKMMGNTGVKNNPLLLTLTPSEMKVCHFIQAGKSSKEVAEALNLSVGTINTHRKNIRKKVGLTGSDKSLFQYLQNPDLFT
ncbi:LuxR C-terminal-related transcriptional regulator [Desulfonatronovibrio magnus]|uniref:LuxR C-terminal-related transcriptional regulator n=1 Tax=Desulfonatronovibrio magnus TaxID=698827 RepID=UPI0005EBDF66|nr:LuxR C-terminal-related transcriptional regulator [Desulfonatronovibrio magnus]